MKKFVFLILLCSMLQTSYLYAEKAFIYILVSGIAIANGIYLSDKKDELYQKSNTYHQLGVNAQLNSEEAARRLGESEAFIDIAIYLNDLQLLSLAEDEAQKYAQMTEDFHQEAEHNFIQSKSKVKGATRYEWYSGISYAAGGILLIKGIWELMIQENLRYGKTKKKKSSSWMMKTNILPGKTQIFIAKKF